MEYIKPLLANPISLLFIVISVGLILVALTNKKIKEISKLQEQKLYKENPFYRNHKDNPKVFKRDILKILKNNLIGGVIGAVLVSIITMSFNWVVVGAVVGVVISELINLINIASKEYKKPD